MSSGDSIGIVTSIYEIFSQSRGFSPAIFCLNEVALNSQEVPCKDGFFQMSRICHLKRQTIILIYSFLMYCGFHLPNMFDHLNSGLFFLRGLYATSPETFSRQITNQNSMIIPLN